MGYIDKDYIKYNYEVIDNQIVAGEWIKLAAKRMDKFLQQQDKEFREDKVERVISFCEKLRHFQGKSAGKQFKLERWQKWVIANIFGFYWKGTNRRVTNKVLLTMARKNGKSFFASAISLYMLFADGEQAAQVLNVANNSQQAHLLFEMSQVLVRQIDPHNKYTQIYRDSIKYPKSNSYARICSSESSGLDGASPSLATLDETHEMRDSKLYDVFQSGQGFRENPLILQISTSGFHLDGFLYKYREMCIDVLKGLKQDDTLFSAIYEMDKDDDWDDESSWIKSNPNLGITVTKQWLREQIKSAKNNSSLEVSVRTKNLNMWVQSSEIWIPDKLLIDNSINGLVLDEFKGEYCYGGIDLSYVSDLTCYTLMFPPNSKREVFPDKFVFFTRIFIPHDTLYNSPNTEMYKEWLRDGYIKMTSGDYVDYDEILKDLLEDTKDVTPNLIGYDAYNATNFVNNCISMGLNMGTFPQSLSSFNRPTKEFEIMLRKGDVVLDWNPCVRWAFQNATLKYDYNNNCKPIKDSNDQTKKIDPVITILESYGTYISENTQGFGLYDE